jgi:CheY-like chemotaxis protein
MWQLHVWSIEPMSLLTFLTNLADPRPEKPAAQRSVPDIRAIALVIDDDPGMRSLMTLSLEQCGYHVMDVANGTEAIAIAQEVTHLDLIVADLELHGVQGPAVVNSLRAISGYVPVVYVSDCCEGVIGVADPVLQKPFLCGEWLQAVAGVVGVLPRDRRVAA